MKTRASRLLLAVALLAAAWPAFARLLGGAARVLAAAGAAHPAVLLAALAAVLLAGTVPGPVDRALTRLTARGRT